MLQTAIFPKLNIFHNAIRYKGQSGTDISKEVYLDIVFYLLGQGESFFTNCSYNKMCAVQ